jgi:hypothetical protein
MFKKIRSDRDPRETVISELKKEFRPYFSKAGQGLKGAAERYPKFLFWMMVINIGLSAILCFTVFRHREIPEKKIQLTAPVTHGLDEIIQAGSALRQTIELKKQVDSLTKKKKLSSADSATLLKDLDSLNHIKIKP